jgi:ubiquinone/menaquinone biosynthesis C-methylase UbiE/uncharacterized protein YbaR (Trm112 family)
MTNPSIGETQSLKGFWEILQCPFTGSRLTLADDKRLLQLNNEISKGNRSHLDGTPVSEELQQALVSSDGLFFYAILEGVLILLPNLAIPFNKEQSSRFAVRVSAEKKATMNFYDRIGWKEVRGEVFEDANRFEDLRPVSSEYIRNCNMRLKKYLRPTGKYLLDIASGPIQYPEYLRCSEDYDFRICGDLSFTALMAARKKLGDRGIYVLCDITNLPFKPNSIDGFVSLHTIYHVPAKEQVQAVREVYRVLKENCSGAIVYTWGDHSLFMRIAFFNPVCWIKETLRRSLPSSTKETIKKMIGRNDQSQNRDGESTRLYFHANSYQWYREELKVSLSSDLASWRSVSVDFMRRYVHSWFFGKQILALIYWMEDRFPRFLGKYGAYPIFVCRKKSA